MTTLFSEGDAIRGDRITVNARRIRKVRVINPGGTKPSNSLCGTMPTVR